MTAPIPIPSPPVRVPTPTLDALYAKYAAPGAQRFFRQGGNALGENDCALELYDRRVLDTTQQKVSDEDYAAVSSVDVLHARSYPILYARWCADYNGGFNIGEGPNETPLPQSLAQPTPPPSPYLKPAPPQMSEAEEFAAWKVMRAAAAPDLPSATPVPVPVASFAPWPPAPAPPPLTRWQRVVAFLKHHLT